MFGFARQKDLDDLRTKLNDAVSLLAEVREEATISVEHKGDWRWPVHYPAPERLGAGRAIEEICKHLGVSLSFEPSTPKKIVLNKQINASDPNTFTGYVFSYDVDQQKTTKKTKRKRR